MSYTPLKFLLLALCSIAVLVFELLSVSYAQESSFLGSAITSQISAGSSSTRTETPPRWAVFDSLSQQVGTLVGFRDNGVAAVVGMELLGESFLVGVRSDRFVGNTGGVYFESDNCTGSPLIIFRKTLSPLIAIGPPGNMVYIAAGDTEAPLEVVTGSTLNTETVGCKKVKVSGLKFVRARPLFDLFRIFVPPFTLQLVGAE